MPTLVTLLPQILLPILFIKSDAKTSFIGSQFEVFSDLVESLMYDAIKKEKESDSDKVFQDGQQQQSMTFLNSKIAKRRTSVNIRVPIAKMKTREVVADLKDKTRQFFSSRKVVSRQRKPGGNRDKGQIQTLALNTKTENHKEDVQSRLEKLRELFQMVRVSKKEPKNKSKVNSPKISKKRVFKNNRRVIGDNCNDADINTWKKKNDVAKKEHRTEALANLFKIAGDDWVRTNVDKETE